MNTLKRCLIGLPINGDGFPHSLYFTQPGVRFEPTAVQEREIGGNHIIGNNLDQESPEEAKTVIDGDEGKVRRRATWFVNPDSEDPDLSNVDVVTFRRYIDHARTTKSSYLEAFFCIEKMNIWTKSTESRRVVIWCMNIIPKR